MRDDETRHLTAQDVAQDRLNADLWAKGQEDRKAAGYCARWGHGSEACILPYDHRGSCKDAQGNTTLSLTRALLGREL